MNPFIGIDTATLLTLKTAYVAALVSLAQNQGYSLNGRSLTRANLTEVKTTLGQITAAIDWNDNAGVNQTLVSFTGL